MDGHHTHGSNNGAGLGFMTLGALALFFIIGPILHMILIILAGIGGLAVGGGTVYILYRRNHPRAIRENGRQAIPPAQNHIHLHGLTAEQIREIMGR